MVYCGKLSTACERCRKRRIKCDERHPQCSQCIRAQHPCPGYRNVQLLSFRDQSEDVIRKVHNRSKPSPSTDNWEQSHESPATHSPATAKYEDREETEAMVSQSDMLTVFDRSPDQNQPILAAFSWGETTVELSRSLSPSVRDVATCFFWDNYVLDDIRSGQGWLRHLPTGESLYQSPAVMAVIEAIGLASVSNIERVPALMIAARRSYSEAVSWTNTILQHPTECLADSTLAAVILLGMFEVITGNGTNSIHFWRDHITGATKLIEMRGIHQLQSPHGLQMFTQLRTQIVINNIYWETNTSLLIAELSACAENLRYSEQTPVDRLANIIIRLSGFCAAVKAGQVSDPATVISQALALDMNLVSWAGSLPDGWAYSTFRSGEGNVYYPRKALFRDEYHVYPTMWISTAWNNYRSARIIVHEFILDFLAEMQRRSPTRAEENTSLEEQSRNILAQMVEDICAGALYHIGPCLLDTLATASGNNILLVRDQSLDNTNILGSDAAAGMSGLDMISPTAGQGRGYVAAGGYLLMWPAFLAAACSYTHTEATEWLTQCLEKIGFRMGIHQALAMVALLRKGLDSRVWLRRGFENLFDLQGISQ